MDSISLGFELRMNSEQQISVYHVMPEELLKLRRDILFTAYHLTACYVNERLIAPISNVRRKMPSTDFTGEIQIELEGELRGANKQFLVSHVTCKNIERLNRKLRLSVFAALYGFLFNHNMLLVKNIEREMRANTAIQRSEGLSVPGGES